MINVSQAFHKLFKFSEKGQPFRSYFRSQEDFVLLIE